MTIDHGCNLSSNPKIFTSTQRSRYFDKLKRLPPTGAGYHPAILGVANTGVRMGLNDQDIFNDIRSCTVERGREVLSLFL